MSQSITIKSINYDGEMATILFLPYNESSSINLGTVVLPFTFHPNLLEPPKNVYGTYTILIDDVSCSYTVNVPPPTPTTTPTNTPTKTQTSTPTQTQTPTPSFDPCKVPTQTPTPTLTQTPTTTYTPTPSSTCTNPCGC